MLPFAVKLSGLIYLASALVLGAGFMVYAIKIYREYSDQLARKTFRYSIIYLTALFAALLVDHYIRIVP
jgi:protoheme IX farnesyltransferase